MYQARHALHTSQCLYTYVTLSLPPSPFLFSCVSISFSPFSYFFTVSFSPFSMYLSHLCLLTYQFVFHLSLSLLHLVSLSSLLSPPSHLPPPPPISLSLPLLGTRDAWSRTSAIRELQCLYHPELLPLSWLVKLNSQAPSKSQEIRVLVYTQAIRLDSATNKMQ